MTRIDFYILQSNTPQARAQFACRLTEKAYSQANRVYLHAADAGQATQLDTLLWTFRQGSFVPHQQHDAAHSGDCPVVIGHQHEPEDHNQVLINLDQQVPLFFSRFERVVEIVDEDENTRQRGRERFKFYRDRGYDLHSHNISL